MITKLINFIGNRKIVLGIIFVIVISIVGYNIPFSTTKKEFDTDDDGKIDKVEYYRKGVKVKELIYYDKAIPKGVEYIFWNKDGGINKITDIYSDLEPDFSKTIESYSKGKEVDRLGTTFIKQELIVSKIFDKKGKLLKTQPVGNYYIYSKDRKISFAEMEMKRGIIHEVVLFDLNGRTKQIKEDKDSNGKFEYYEFYEHGKKTAVGYDYDEDGEIDKKEEVKNKSR